MARHYGTAKATLWYTARRMGLPRRNPSRWHMLTIGDFRALQMRRAMEVSARETAAALMDSEMVDNRQAARLSMRRAAA
jgi:hypothetical protein